VSVNLALYGVDHSLRAEHVDIFSQVFGSRTLFTPLGSPGVRFYSSHVPTGTYGGVRMKLSVPAPLVKLFFVPEKLLTIPYPSCRDITSAPYVPVGIVSRIDTVES